MCDDDPVFAHLMKVGLEHEGFAVDVVHDASGVLQYLRRRLPDLVLLDVVLPDQSGVELCRYLRNRFAPPVILVSGLSSEGDRVAGLLANADDYVCKPFRPRELAARIRTILRRAGRSASSSDGILEANDVQLDVQRHQVIVRGQPVSLSMKEFRLLELLLAGAGSVVSRWRLINELWGGRSVGVDKLLDSYVRRLRAALEEDPSRPVLITTLRGQGYRFEIDRPVQTQVVIRSEGQLS